MSGRYPGHAFWPLGPHQPRRPAVVDRTLSVYQETDGIYRQGRLVKSDVFSSVGVCRHSDYILRPHRRFDPPLVVGMSSCVASLTTLSILGAAMISPSPIHPHSFLGYLCAHQPIVTSTGKPLARLAPL